MFRLLLYTSLLFHSASISYAKPIAVNDLIESPTGNSLNSRSRLIVRPTNSNTSAQFISSGHLLQKWPDVPFEIPIHEQDEGARINIFKVFRQANGEQTREAVDLLNGEINKMLEEKGEEAGPTEMKITADFTTIWMYCHAGIRATPNDRWSFYMALDMLKTLKLYIDVEGFKEMRFDVVDNTDWMANCEMMLDRPDDRLLDGQVTRLTKATKATQAATA